MELHLKTHQALNQRSIFPSITNYPSSSSHLFQLQRGEILLSHGAAVG